MTAVVVDPFGNLLGIMYNQHYLDTLARVTGASVTGAHADVDAAD